MYVTSYQPMQSLFLIKLKLHIVVFIATKSINGTGSYVTILTFYTCTNCSYKSHIKYFTHILSTINATVIPMDLSNACVKV